MPATATATQATIWNRMIEARPEMPLDAADFVLDLQLRDADKSRMVELNDLANNGTLTDHERSELEEYIHVGDLLSILHSKARQAKRHHG